MTVPNGTNIGKISSHTDNISGETVAYTYDSLNRLATSAGSGWTQNFGYDAFGNLVSKSGTNSPVLSIAANPATNQIVGQTYDLNGNQLSAPAFSGAPLVYDSENRLQSAPGVQYAYDCQNKRIWKAVFDGSGNVTGQEVYFYGIDGQKLGTYTLTINGTSAPQLADPPASVAVFFGGKRVAVNGTAFVPDRLGSNGKYFPYGEDRGTPLPNDQVKFATYTRDSATGLDYADQRYYASAFGRFMLPDPYRASSGPADPGSWNRYSYTRGDPVNRLDARGMDDTCPDPTEFRASSNTFPDCLIDPAPPQDPPRGIPANSFLINLIQMRTQQYQPKLEDAISKLSANCKAAIGTALGKIGQTFNGFQFSAGLIQFVDTTATEGLYTLNQIAGLNIRGLDVTALSASIPLVAAGALGFVVQYTPPGYAGTGGAPTVPIIFLTSLFPLFPQWQPTILVHEALHIVTSLDDAHLAQLLGATPTVLTGVNASTEASKAISDWLQNDCKTQ